MRNVAGDGHTLFIGDAGTLVVNPLIQRELPYDPVRDFVPITRLLRATFFILTGQTSRFGGMGELLAVARAQPGVVTYASLGNGHPSHVAIESLAAESDVTLLQVPFKDAGAAFTAVVNNDVDFMAFSWNSVSGLIKAGKLRPLAVAVNARSSEAPQVPTLAEAGAPPVEMRPWAALVAPAQTPIDADRIRYGALVRSGRVSRN